MKPLLRELSTEQLEQLSNDEIIGLVVSEIKSSRATNADLEEEHVRLAHSAAARKEIRKLWREEKEWRAKQAEPKVVAFRRYIPQFPVPEPSPKSWVITNHLAKDATARKAIIVEAAKPKEEPEEEPRKEERFQFDETVTTPALSKSAPMDNAIAFARDRLYKNGNLATFHYHGDWWQWNGRFYEIAPPDRISASIYNYLHGARVGDERFKPKPEHAEALMKCLKANIAIDDRDEPPRWLPKAPAELAKLDAGSLLVFRNYLVDVMTGKVVDLTPHLWVHGGVDFDYDETAQCPRWEQFLEEIFPHDPDSQMTIEEQLGYGMTFDNRFDKAAMWIGLKRSGKSTLAWVQEKLCGTGVCVSLSFHDWTKTENSHENIIGRKVGIFSDVRLKPGKWYGQNYDAGGLTHDSVQLLLKITGRDKISVKRKWIGPWEGLLLLKLIITSNAVLNLQDEGGVLWSRFIYLYFAQSFYGREDVTLRTKLERELPGIANRCSAAYRRLLARGRFIQPASGQKLLQKVEEQGDPYAAFMNDYFVEDPNGQVTCFGFYLLFQEWCEANGQLRLLQSITGANQLIRQVNKIDRWSWLGSIQSSNTRVYPGIKKKVV